MKANCLSLNMLQCTRVVCVCFVFLYVDVLTTLPPFCVYSYIQPCCIDRHEFLGNTVLNDVWQTVNGDHHDRIHS